MKRLTQADLLLVNERAKTFIVEFPRGGKLKGMTRPCTESEIRTIAFVEAVRSHCGDTEIMIETPDSDTVNE